MNKTTILKNVVDINTFDRETFDSNDIGIEIQSFPQHLLDDDCSELLNRYQEKLQGFSNIIALHGASFDLNPGSTDRRVAKLTKYRYLQSINVAQSLGGTYVIFHSQVNPLISVPNIRKLKLDNQVKFWKELLQEIEDTNITVLLENEYDDHYKDLLYLVENINSDKVKVCLDVGHALAYSKLSLEEWIGGLGPYIQYIHLHWNDRTNDSHLIPAEDELRLLKDILFQNNLSPVLALEYGVEDITKEISRLRSIIK